MGGTPNDIAFSGERKLPLRHGGVVEKTMGHARGA
jgi:hypothetical protein